MEHQDKKSEMLLEKQRWSNRRRMAWVALISMILATAGMLFWVDIARLSLLENVVEMFYWAMTAVIGTYMGFTAWTHTRSLTRTETSTHTSKKEDK